MNEDFTPFELAKKLKKKGFKQDCIAYYMPHSDELIYNIKPYKGVELYSFNSLRKELISSDFIDAPTISQVLKWLREEKKLFVLPSIDDLGWCYSVHTDLYWDGCGNLVRSSYHAKSYFETYEEAMLAGIEYCLDNLI